VKYTPSGEIAIAIRPKANCCEIAIRDHGPGIAADHVDQIFERYRRGAVRTATPAGTGLGLYVARQIIQAHGGELWLAINGPTGCEFALTLPQDDLPQQKGKS
jgi:signal transduction histidine kinase